MSAGSNSISSRLARFECAAVRPSTIRRLVSGISGAGTPCLLTNRFTTFVFSIGIRTATGVIRQDFTWCRRVSVLVYDTGPYRLRKAQFNLRKPERDQATHYNS